MKLANDGALQAMTDITAVTLRLGITYVTAETVSFEMYYDDVTVTLE